MDALILAGKELTELFPIDVEKLAEPLSNVAVKRQVRAILHAALNDHIAEFDLLAGPDLQFEQLVTALLVLYS